MLRVQLIGELRVELGERPIPLPRSRPAQTLLGWLALNPGPHARAALAARFWPDVLDASARANLRNTIWVLRTAIAGDTDHLLATRDSVGLAADALWTDVAEFGRLVREGRDEAALELCRGDLLPELDDEWVLEARDQQRREVGEALGRLAHEAEGRGELDRAVTWSRRRAALEPLSEDACRDLMQLLSAAGNRSGALAAYAGLSGRFRQELRMATSPETRALAERIRQGPLSESPPSAVGAGHETRTRLPSDLLSLVGRTLELSVFERAWADACAGRGSVVLLAGEAGIGKTRLVAEIAARAIGNGFVAVGAGLDLDGAAPFALWAELIHDLMTVAGPVPADTGWAPELARLAPGLQASAAEVPTPAASPELERARLFEAAAAMVEWAAARRPCRLVMVDGHAADPASLALAGYVGKRAARMSLLVVMTRRDVPPRSEVDALLDRLRASGVPSREVALTPLAPAEIARLARAVGLRSRSGVERVVDVADGNPLLAIETARALAAGSPESPATLRAAVRATAGGLDADARMLAELAAVAGRDLEREEVDLLPVPGLADATVRAVEAGLLAVRQGRVGYRHALLREVMLADIAEPRRAQLHETLAEAIAQVGGRRRAGEIARHLRLAGRHDRALSHLVEAAADARAVAALPEAAGFLEEALRIREDDPEIWLALSEVEAWRGRHAEIRRTFDRAVTLIGPSRPGALVEAHLRYARLWRGALCDPEECHRHYRAALSLSDEAGVDADGGRAEALAGVAWSEAVAGSAEAAEEALRDLHRLVGRSRPDNLLAHDVGVARAHILIRRGRFAESYGPLIAAADSARAAGRADMVYGALGWAASAAAAAGDFDRALALVDRALGVIRQAGLSPLEALLESARANILARLDRVADARDGVRRLRHLAERLDDERLAALAAHDAGMIELKAGQHEAAEALLAESLARSAPVSRPLARLARAEALALLGRCEEAETELRETALEPLSPSDFPDTLVARLARVQGLIARSRGDRALAARRLQEAARGWLLRLDPANIGHAYSSALIDLGRVPVAGLIEPQRELERLAAELAGLEVEVPS